MTPPAGEEEVESLLPLLRKKSRLRLSLRRLSCWHLNLLRKKTRSLMRPSCSAVSVEEKHDVSVSEAPAARTSTLKKRTPQS